MRKLSEKSRKNVRKYSSNDCASTEKYAMARKGEREKGGEGEGERERGRVCCPASMATQIKDNKVATTTTTTTVK